MKNVFFIFSILIASSCTPTNDNNCHEIACTEEFRTVTISIKNQANQAFVLDSYRTIIKSSQVFFTNEDSFGGDGFYSILNDSQMDKTTVAGEIFIFEGIKDGQIVVSEEFVIKKDCCHISYVSGNTTINI